MSGCFAGIYVINLYRIVSWQQRAAAFWLNPSKGEKVKPRSNFETCLLRGMRVHDAVLDGGHSACASESECTCNGDAAPARAARASRPALHPPRAAREQNARQVGGSSPAPALGAHKPDTTLHSHAFYVHIHHTFRPTYLVFNDLQDDLRSVRRAGRLPSAQRSVK
jgi:hypothetical protein